MGRACRAASARGEGGYGVKRQRPFTPPTLPHPAFRPCPIWPSHAHIKWAGDTNPPGDKYNSQALNYGNLTNSTLSVSNVRTRSATVDYAFNISNPCVRHDNVSHAETADSYTHPESNPPSQQMSPVPLRQMSPASPVQASAHSETELYPPSNPSPAGTELYPPETPPLASPVPPPRADEGPVSSRTRSAKAGVRSI